MLLKKYLTNQIAFSFKFYTVILNRDEFKKIKLNSTQRGLYKFHLPYPILNGKKIYIIVTPQKI